MLSSAVQTILDAAVANGAEDGAQCTVYLRGELVVDAWAGKRKRGSRDDVGPNTVFPVFSAGKAIAVTAILRLIEKGILSLDMKIADVWREFACHGKQNITLRQILTHRSGLFETPPFRDLLEFADWDAMCAKIAGMTPAFPPGTATRYQADTFSWLLGETVRRADGRHFSTVIRDEVLQPLALQNSIFFGITEEEERRIAHLERGADLLPVREGEIPLEERMNNTQIRRACLPAFNGLASARALAIFYAGLIGDLPGHPPLLKPETLESASICTRPADDPLKRGSWERFGLGFALFGPSENFGQIIGHEGYGGAVGIVDRKKHLIVAYTKNIMHAELRTREKIFEAAGLEIRKGW